MKAEPLKNKEVEQRLALIKYAIDTGFIIQTDNFVNLKTYAEKIHRIKTLMNDGYRIMLHSNSICVINILGRIVSEEIIIELQEAYKWLTNDEAFEDVTKEVGE